MPCRTIDLGGGATAIVCSRGSSKQSPCDTPGCGRPHLALCDYPLKNGKTCDRKMCNLHRKSVGPDRDYCGPHAKLETELELY